MTSRPMEAELAAQGHRREDAATPEPASIEAIERQLFEMVYRQMRALTTGREPDLDDLVQDAMEQALRSLNHFEGRSKLSTWTFQICYRTLLKRRRWYSRWLRRFSFSLSGELPEPQLGASNALSTLEERERAARLHAALQQVSPKKRAVVVLHDFEGLSCEEIVDVVGAKLGTVRSRLRDGRRELAQLLSDDEAFKAEDVS